MKIRRTVGKRRDRQELRPLGVVYDFTIPYDLRFFQSLDRFVQPEPWLTRDKAMIDQLKSIGIEKCKPFRPDEATKGILNVAAREAHAWMDLKYETMFLPYYEGAQVGLSLSRRTLLEVFRPNLRSRIATRSTAAVSPTRWHSSAPSIRGSASIT